jgi:hypothetical protein
MTKQYYAHSLEGKPLPFVPLAPFDAWQKSVVHHVPPPLHWSASGGEGPILFPLPLAGEGEGEGEKTFGSPTVIHLMPIT